ncbi:hypothetical protein RHMOL_Rhmol04G0289400 [Rhododendron molle]|uniref:Uncharacterized protein n=1 Tax=Rhododendron molle TaxID=49168 RepID=A0ACC0P6R8_RHOML|nr:hypothetical protein RHMOL_Rhmol04G0289400 [Rhododendron molle]
MQSAEQQSIPAITEQNRGTTDSQSIAEQSSPSVPEEQQHNRSASLVFYIVGLTTGPMEFSGMLSWTKQHRGASPMVDTIFKLSLATTMYWLWRERNGRVFHNLCRVCSSCFIRDCFETVGLLVDYFEDGWIAMQPHSAMLIGTGISHYQETCLSAQQEVIDPHGRNVRGFYGDFYVEKP